MHEVGQVVVNGFVEFKYKYQNYSMITELLYFTFISCDVISDIGFMF